MWDTDVFSSGRSDPVMDEASGDSVNGLMINLQ
jgi:hypothetical protein